MRGLESRKGQELSLTPLTGLHCVPWTGNLLYGCPFTWAIHVSGRLNPLSYGSCFRFIALTTALTVNQVINPMWKALVEQLFEFLNSCLNF
jgi:hypothetical protein